MFFFEDEYVSIQTTNTDGLFPWVVYTFRSSGSQILSISYIRADACDAASRGMMGPWKSRYFFRCHNFEPAIFLGQL